MTNHRKTQINRPHIIRNPAFSKRLDFLLAVAIENYPAAETERYFANSYRRLFGNIEVRNLRIDYPIIIITSPVATSESF